jgi:hypothetical protein
MDGCDGFTIHTATSTFASTQQPSSSALFRRTQVPKNPYTILKQSSGSSDDDVDTSSSITSNIQNLYSGLAQRPLLAGLDFTAFMLFASIGKASHAPDGGMDPLAVAVTAFPFLVSWFAVTPLLGLYKSDATSISSASISTLDTLKPVVLRTALGWGVAVPLGIALRGLIKGYVPPTPFIVVTLISTLVLLGVERVVYSKIAEKVNS